MPIQNNYTIAPGGYTSDCWWWDGEISESGRATFRIRSRGASAYKRMYEKHRGRVPDGLELDHLCENPACVNPAHLEPVTHKENMRRARERRLHRLSLSSH